MRRFPGLMLPGRGVGDHGGSFSLHVHPGIQTSWVSGSVASLVLVDSVTSISPRGNGPGDAAGSRDHTWGSTVYHVATAKTTKSMK
jgi:hypothetical protein